MLLITWLLYIGVRESARANNIMVVVKLLVLGLFVVLGAMHIDTGQLHAVRAERLARHPPGRGDRLLRLHRLRRDLDRGRGDARTRSATCRIGILGGLAICTLIYVIVGIVATGLVPYQQLKAADPLARALEVAGLPTASWIVAFGAVVSLTAVLLVFQYGQPRIFFAMARDGLLPQWASKIHPKYRTPHITTVVTGLVVALGSLVAGRERDLRPDEHRHAGGVRDRLHRRAGAASTRSRTGRGRSGCRSSGLSPCSAPPPASTS